MSTEIRWASLILVASFAATFTFLWWHRETVLVFLDSPPLDPEPPSPPLTPQPGRPSPSAAPVDSEPKPVLAQVRPASTAVSPTDEPPLPLLVSVTNQPADTRLDASDGTNDSGSEPKSSNHVEILNTSDQLLAVTVIDVNLPTQKSSSTQVLLPPNGQAHIGAEASLAMESGDAITLRSSGFRDISQTVP